MASKRTVRLDQMVIVALGCLVTGYLLGIATAVLIQGKPAPLPPTAGVPAPAVAPPSSALGSLSAEIRELRSIVAKDPGNGPVWTRLGNLLFDADQFMDAIEAYTKALEIQPDDPDVLTDRGIMYRKIGDFQSALADFRKAAQIAPTHLNSVLNQGIVLRYDLNDIPGAIQAWKAYLSRNPPADMAEKIRSEVESLQTMQK